MGLKNTFNIPLSTLVIAVQYFSFMSFIPHWCMSMTPVCVYDSGVCICVWYVYMHVVCVYMYAYVYMFICIYVYTCTYGIYTRVCACTYMYVCVYMHI